MVAAETNAITLLEWLIDDMGARVNGVTPWREGPLANAASGSVVRALLARGANPTVIVDRFCGYNVLMHQCYEPGFGRPSCIASLLADPRVLARIDDQCEGEEGEFDGFTALHLACDTHFNRYDVCAYNYDEDDVDWERARVIELLILAGADPVIPNTMGKRPLDTLRARDPDNASRYLLEHLACESIPSLVLKIRHQLDAARVVGAKIAGVRALTEKAPGVNGAREGGRGTRVKTRASLVVERKEEIVEVTKEVAKEGAYGNRGRKTNGADFFFLSFFLFYAGGCTIPFSLFFLPLTLH